MAAGHENGWMPGSHRVVIVGGGFGGLACARALDGSDASVLLLDRHNYHLFTPLLYQVATALLNPSDIAYPLRKVFRRSRNVRFLQGVVSEVHMARRLALLRDAPPPPSPPLPLPPPPPHHSSPHPPLPP